MKAHILTRFVSTCKQEAHEKLSVLFLPTAFAHAALWPDSAQSVTRPSCACAYVRFCVTEQLGGKIIPPPVQNTAGIRKLIAILNFYLVSYRLAALPKLMHASAWISNSSVCFMLTDLSFLSFPPPASQSSTSFTFCIVRMRLYLPSFGLHSATTTFHPASFYLIIVVLSA